MAPEIDPKLEAFIDRHLGRLASPSAPASLVPEVLAAIRARAALPWWRGSWWEWPWPARVGFVVLACFVACFFAGASWFLSERLDIYSVLASDPFNPSPAFAMNVSSALLSAIWLWQTYAQPFLLHALVAALLCYLACMGLGTAFVRVALRRC